MVAFVYKIENTANGKFYVGSTTKSIKRRYSEHLCQLNKNSHKNPHLQNSFNKYGKDCFRIVAIEEIVNLDNLSAEDFHKLVLKKELDYIISFNPDYNICKETRSGKLGRTLSEEEKNKISLISKNRKVTEETKERIRIARAKQVITEEHKMKISKSLKGIPGKGGKKFYTLEEKESISERVKSYSIEKKGCHSEESKLKRAETVKALFATEEMRERLKKMARQRHSKEFVCKKDNVVIGTFKNQSHASEVLKVTQGGISSVLVGKQKTHKGYVFEYIKQN
jgi:group I intron endonuclease